MTNFPEGMNRLAALFMLALLLHIGDALACGDIGPRKPSPPPPPPNYHGLYHGPTEPGWGIGISHEGGRMHATWFTYDRNGDPTWFVMPELRTAGSMYTAYAGQVYLTTVVPGSSGVTLDESRVLMVPLGSVDFDFTSGLFSYSLGPRRTRKIARNVFNLHAGPCDYGSFPANAQNQTDLWAPASGAWAVYIAQQGDVVFATWLTYRADGNNEWLVMPRLERTGAGMYAGPMYRTHGPAYDAVSWDASKVTFAQVGQAKIAFAGDQAQFEFTADGVPGSKTITRRTIAQVANVCIP